MTEKNPSVSYPARTKLIIAGVLAVAIGCFALAIYASNTDDGGEVTVGGRQGDLIETDGVEGRFPGEDDQVQGQQSIGIDLAPSWAGELVLQPSSGAAIVLPEDEIEQTALNELIFQPGEGRTIERLPQGNLCVRATIWDRARGREASERVESWCFSVF